MRAALSGFCRKINPDKEEKLAGAEVLVDLVHKIEQALAIVPSDANVLNDYALSRAMANDLDGALKLLERAAAAPNADLRVRQNLALPGVGGNFKSLKLPHDLERGALALNLSAGREVLPAQKPLHELGSRDRLNAEKHSSLGRAKPGLRQRLSPERKHGGEQRQVNRRSEHRRLSKRQR